MYTLKCYKHNGIKHVYEARMYTIHPPKANISGDIITVVESSEPGTSSRPLHHVSLDPLDFAYKEIFVENIAGKTVDIIRGSTKAHDSPDDGQAHDIKYPQKSLKEKASEAGLSEESLLPVEDDSEGTVKRGAGDRVVDEDTFNTS